MQNFPNWSFGISEIGSITALVILLGIFLLVLYLLWKNSNKRLSSLARKKHLTAKTKTHVNVVAENIHDSAAEFERNIKVVRRASIAKEKFTAGTPVNRPTTGRLEDYHAFLSYNSEDELVVRSIYEYLTDHGLRVWFDHESIKPGDDWMESLQKGIEDSKVCLVLYRDEAGGWQEEETKQAIRKRHREDSSFKIIPVLLPGGTDTEPPMSPFLQGMARVDLRKGLFNPRALKRLVEAIRGDDVVPIHQVTEESETHNNLPTGYKADVRKIISLLIGEALYSRRDVCIRELLQNAVDACERLDDSRFGAAANTKITVNIDSEEGYFEVIDNGDGMSPEILSDYFAVIGRSIRDEESVMERTQGDEKIRAHLIGKFGIGFISTYMLAERIVISTTHEGREQINFEINGISEPFVYHHPSKLGRLPDENGTTIRVYLKDVFLSTGRIPLDIAAIIQEFCRHVQYVNVFKDGKRVTLEDVWNIKRFHVVDVTNVPFKFELRLGLTKGNEAFYASNAGFLINRSSDQISPEFMPTNIGGEINFYPGIVDLNMARDTIIVNDRSTSVRRLVSKAIKNLLIRIASEGNEEERRTVKKILVAYLDLALKYEEKGKTKDQSLFSEYHQPLGPNAGSEAPPLSSIEAAELLMDVWEVEVNESKISLREALSITMQNGRNRIYIMNRRGHKVFDVIEESLKKRGFVVVSSESEDVSFKSGKSGWYRDLPALQYLGKRYYFDVYTVEDPYIADIEDLIISQDSLSPAFKRVIRDVESSAKRSVHLSGLKGAPVVFVLSGKTYLNVGSDLLSNALASFDSYDKSIVKSYILGLLHYEIR